MNARGLLVDALDLALVGEVALWIGVSGAFLASLSPARVHAVAPAVHRKPSEPARAAPGSTAGACGIPSGAEDGAAQHPATVDEDFLARLAELESGGDDSATNAAEGAVGRYQIRAVYLADGNAAAGTSYTLEDMRDPDKAARIVGAYLERYGAAFARRTGRPATAVELARIHNGGPRGAERSATAAYGAAFAALGR